MPDEVHQALLDHFELERHIGGYAAEAQADAREGARKAAAKLLGCDPEEIALTESAQSAWAKAFYSFSFREGDRIFCWASEYAGNAVAFLQAAKRHAKLEVLPMRPDGIVDLDALEAALKSLPETARAVVALTHIQTNSSVVQPAAAVGKLAREHGAVFILDACQSIGQIPVDVRSLLCDFACATGRKWLRGPRGTGFLYARASALNHASGLVGEPPMIDHVSARWTQSHVYKLAPDARRYEMWETSPALHMGLKKALELCEHVGPQHIQRKSTGLAAALRQKLASIKGVRCCDAPASLEEAQVEGVSRCAIVTFEAFSDLGITSEAIKGALAKQRIAVSVSPPFHTFNDEDWRQPSVVRVSPSYYNDESEVDVLAQKIKGIIETLSENSGMRAP
ncbi:csd [Symbiodinium natans]|uniref:Csd protein n=1 Tax=Symbiodinium natans TaxID=878477 RepID=A0A812V2D1_9DINO|nr:csd [Symbiodinium natans]